jgi:hypothetical protein
LAVFCPGAAQVGNEAAHRQRVLRKSTPFACPTCGADYKVVRVDGSAKSIEEIAKREGCSPRKVNMTLSLALLAPEIVKAAIDGRLPRGVGISRLSDPPPSWREQFRQLGIAAPPVD